MMSKKRIFGLSIVTTLLLGASVSLYVAPGVAISKPTQIAEVSDGDSDPTPQRFEVAQAKTGGNSTLPGGASSLNETYKDWRVACVQQAKATRCVLSQVQVQQNGQRVLAIELNAPMTTTVSGTLILPFGLALDSGITFQIDEKPAMQSARFRTCIPGGCLVNVSFDAATLVALRAGAALKVKATSDGGAFAPFSISLEGFGTALDRVAALSR